ncbi:MAG: hypothetical protein REI64_13510 [Pedobacter sp.]|uniref:hypothetical protein n=1 Tax=Pedobacter sp. TaxID=1411316 RepID=UPI00280951CF|nr:hypothetical protein [Pedobacter sp.]MDQ8005815.1 hypothetical protein [Pedobacter sp.]
MVEVFKTNVNDHLIAQQVLDKIEFEYKELDASFDLDDCDKIFRICTALPISGIRENVHKIFEELGSVAIPLEDESMQSEPFTTNSNSSEKVAINSILSFF